MQTLAELSESELRSRLKNDQLRLHVGPYVYSIQSSLPTIYDGLSTLYGDFVLAGSDGFADYHVSIRSPNLVQSLRRKVDFYADDQRPFNRIHSSQAWAFLEWGMNWCVSIRANEYLKLHAAVVSKNNIAFVMPGLPGAGKSTLCAALALDGWRVLSDEHALVPLGSSELVPLCRPISLKNESIELMQDYSSRVVLGPQCRDTHKGRVAHMKADLVGGSHDDTPVPARILMFPKFTPGSKLRLRQRGAAESFIFAAHHSFNYSTLGLLGYQAMERFIDDVDCFDLEYSQLDQAIDSINALHAELEP